MGSKIISSVKISRKQVSNTVKRYIINTKYSPDITQEVLLIIDKVYWISIYWNPVSKIWHISQHSREGWSEPQYQNHEILEGDIVSGIYNSILDNTFAVQYRTSAGVRVYKKLDE